MSFSRALTLCLDVNIEQFDLHIFSIYYEESAESNYFMISLLLLNGTNVMAYIYLCKGIHANFFIY